MGGVPAIDVEGLVGLGVSEVFGFGEGLGVGESGLGHALENVVGGAVDDSSEGFDAIANKGFLHGLDNGDGSRNSGLEVDGGFVLS